MNYNQGRPNWPPPFNPGGAVSSTRPPATVANRCGTPPLYRPQQALAVAQPKIGAPPVYRTSPLSHSLAGNLGGQGAGTRMPGGMGPPVYKPQQAPVTAQPKIGGAPPVYHPNALSHSLAGNLGGLGVGTRRPGLIGPSVYKPPQAAVTAQPKMGGPPPLYRPCQHTLPAPLSLQPKTALVGLSIHRPLHIAMPLQRGAMGGLRGGPSTGSFPPMNPFLGVVQQKIKVGEVERTAQEMAEHLGLDEERHGDDLIIEILQWMDNENKKFDGEEDLTREIREVTGTLENAEAWVGGIAKIAVDILKNYPPKDYIYVGLGRSPSPLVAYLKSHGYDARTLPLGGLKLDGKTMKRPMPDLKKAERARLKHLIDQHIPSHTGRGGKKILLLDYVQSGEGLRVGKKLVKELVETPWNVRRKGKVVPLALHVEGFLKDQQLQNLRNATLRPMALPGKLEEENSLAALIGGSKLKPFAQHYKLTFEQAKQGDAPEENPLYRRMFDLLRRAEGPRVEEEELVLSRHEDRQELLLELATDTGEGKY